MIKKLNKIVLKVFWGVLIFACLNLAIDNKAQAIIDVRAGYAFGNLNLDESKVSNESGVNFQVLFQPIIVLPVAAGTSYVYHNVDFSVNDVKYENYERISLDVEAWIPFIPLFTPFAGASFIPWHELSNSSEDGVDSLDMGVSLKAGIKVDLIPLLNMYINGEYSKFKSDDLEYSSLVGVIGLELDL